MMYSGVDIEAELCQIGGLDKRAVGGGAVSKRKYTRDDYEAYFVMLGVVGQRWDLAVGHPGYRNSTGWSLLTRLWRQGPTKMADAYAFLSEIKSAGKRRALIEKAIKDELVDCDDDKLMRQLRGQLKPDEQPVARRGKTSPEIWLAPAMVERIESFLDDVVDELLKTAAGVKVRTRAPR